MGKLEYIAGLCEHPGDLTEAELKSVIRQVDEAVGELSSLAHNLRYLLRTKQIEKADFNYMTGQRPQ